MATDRPARSDFAPDPATGRRTLIVLIVLAFLAGGIAAGWALSRSGWWAGEEAAATASSDPSDPALARLAAGVDPAAGGAPVARPLTGAPLAGSLGPVSEQVDTLEARLADIRLAADRAEGDARRAEAMLLAFAARRTLDRGVPLGFLQAQLRTRFPGQPNAVDTIVDAAARPVPVDDLRADLADLSTVRGGGGLLAFVRGDGPPLLRVRRADQPVRDPARRLAEADAALARGDVDAAVAQVGALSPTDERRAWLADARRYLAARQALDVIETAAILQGSGEAVAAEAR